MTPVQAEKVDADVIDHAIDTLSVVKLRETFKTICKTCPEAKKRAEELLLADQKDVKSGPRVNEDEQEGKDALARDEGAKQPVPRYAFCENCEEEFNVTTSTSTSCRYHTMEDEPDESLYEPNPTNPSDPDSMEAREDFPDAFHFKCCGRDRLEEPCTTGWHKELNEEKPHKRARVGYGISAYS